MVQRLGSHICRTRGVGNLIISWRGKGFFGIVPCCQYIYWVRDVRSTKQKERDVRIESLDSCCCRVRGWDISCITSSYCHGFNQLINAGLVERRTEAGHSHAIDH